MFRAPGQIYPDSGSDRKLFSHIIRRSSRSFLIVDILNRCPRDLLVVLSVSRVQRRTLEHRSITPRSITPTTPSWEDISWRCTTLSLPKKLTSGTANLEWWCHVHFIRDSFITFIRWVIGPGKNSIKLFFNTEFDFKCTWNRDWTITFLHEHLACQSPSRDTEKSTNGWSRYFGTNRIMWRKWKNYFEVLIQKTFYELSIFLFHWPTKWFTYCEDLS